MLARRAPIAAGGQIIFEQAGEFVPIDAVYGRAAEAAEERNAAGLVRVEFGEREFIVRAADVIIAGAVVEPQPGARIHVYDVDAAETVFEVMPTADGKCWRPLDAEGRMIRIHTKRAAT
jgi:hypothetical protein